MSCVMNACHLTIPCFTQHLHGHNKPGWNDYVDEKHGEARSAYLEWMVAGKPRQGFSFVLMNKTRAAFKLALRNCKQHEDMMRADSYARSLSSKDFKSFWSGIHKNSNAKAAQYANVVDGCIGDDNISDMWRKHFEQLYNSVKDDGAKNLFFERLVTPNYIGNRISVTVRDLFDVMSKAETWQSSWSRWYCHGSSVLWR